MKKSPKSLCKLFAFLMAIFIIVSSVSLAFAAEPIVLSETNVVSWPTIEGEIYFGQKLSDGFTVSGGTVTTDGTAEGTVIPGKFEFIDPDYIPTSTNGIAAFKFIPNDTLNYTGFEVEKVYDVMYTVNKVTPVLVDENNPPVASEVEAGARLSTSKISGGQMKNPYNPEESKVLSKTWTWSNGRTTVSESGYYEAKFAPGAGYEIIKMDIYVRIAGETPETSITEYPVISELTYDPNVTWADVTLEGGKAVIKGTETEVEGTFAIKDTRISATPTPSATAVEIVFTPTNLEEALPYEFTIPVKVNPARLAFVDDEGNVVEDFTFEVEPGVKMNDVKTLIQANLRTPKNAVIGVEDNNGYAENGRKYKLTVLHDDTNYTGTELYFTIKFKETEITPTLKWVGEGQLKVDCGEYAPLGTFSVYYVVGETETKIGEVKGNKEILEWTPDASGDYSFRVEYNPADGDYFKIDTVSTSPYSHFPKHKLIATGSLATLGFSMGETATVTAPATDPSLLDKPYYGFTGWTDVKGNTGLSDEELANATVTFTMPDEDVELKANYEFSLKLFFEWIWQQIVQFFTFIINAMKDLFALAVA